ncbi:hypothetical protein ALC56_10037 [Trachymyrmex septentrionalis]|uniref:Uncharacterized protein n=1 Tax=Trachymyrmex septentrionalis TaxID=34720 RepID=A0A195F4H3_9HYME|nr:hypothetical protein ALC56_10037 [Trachymyrmex septentrionalis]
MQKCSASIRYFHYLYGVRLYRVHRQYLAVNSKRAANKRIFSIPALSKEDTQRMFHLRPTLPTGNFRQNEPLVFCHYPLEMVIFGSLRPLSSEMAASDFRASSIQLPQVPKSKKDDEIRKTSAPKTKRAKEGIIRRLMTCCKVIVVVVVCETLSLRLSEFHEKSLVALEPWHWPDSLFTDTVVITDTALTPAPCPCLRAQSHHGARTYHSLFI